jgi:ectoine hydroxylase-related dioxygenase (phytanoyl-CoA dioxygenase family)
MVPGSHIGDIRVHHDRYGEHNILSRGQTIDEVDERHAVDIVLEPGQISLHHGRTIHGSSPNRSNDRRLGVAIQQYIPAHARDTTGKGFAQLARGRDGYRHFHLEPRPKRDMEPEAIALREAVNLHWKQFLYRGAAERRAY